MAGRIRTLKPEWLEDEILAAQEDHVRLLSVSLILLADDHGNGRASALHLAVSVWGMASMSGDPQETLRKASGGLEALSECGFIRLYTVRKQQYFHITNWSKHQRVQRPSKPRVPTPDEADSPDPPTGSDTPSGDPPETLRTDHRPPTTDHRPGPTRARAAPEAVEAPPLKPEQPALDPGGGEVIPIRARDPDGRPSVRAPSDLAEAARTLRRLLSDAWLTVRGNPLTGEHQAVRDVSAWAWELTEGDGARWLEVVRALIDRWAADPWVRENLPKYPAANFRSQLQTLWDHVEANFDPAKRAEAAYEAEWDRMEEQIILLESTGRIAEARKIRDDRELMRQRFYGSKGAS